MRFAYAKSIGLRRLAYGGGGASASEQLLALATDDGWGGLYDPQADGTLTLREDSGSEFVSSSADGLENEVALTESTAARQPELIDEEVFRFSADRLDGDVPALTTFTLMIGIKGLTTGALAHVVGHYLTTGDNRGWRILKDGSAKTLTLAFSEDGTNTLTNIGPSAAVDNAVAEIVASATNVAFLVNGVEVGNSATTGVFNADSNLFLGADQNYSGELSSDMTALVFARSVIGSDDRDSMRQLIADRTGVTL